MVIAFRSSKKAIPIRHPNAAHCASSIRYERLLPPSQHKYRRAVLECLIGAPCHLDLVDHIVDALEAPRVALGSLPLYFPRNEPCERYHKSANSDGDPVGVNEGVLIERDA